MSGRLRSDGIAKLWRFTRIYGPRRALFKAAGRMRRGSPALLGIWRRPVADIGVIGCGQFAFATIGCIVASRFGLRFRSAYDPDGAALQTFSRFYSAHAAGSADAVIGDPGVKLVYVASNHASHARYAMEALAKGHDVYCEKPIAVTDSEFAALLRARDGAKGKLYAGYNRPFSAAVRELKRACHGKAGPMTLACTIQGHVLADDHWYRRPEEGTRICGNVGHWLDLMVHMRSWNGLPRRWRIDCSWSNTAARDDDLTIVLTSEAGDLVSITLTARAEPYEGIAETIVLQWGDVAATIDDFRSLTLHRGARKIWRRYWPKDVGHVRAILQPFAPAEDARDFREVEQSTRLMLAITDMVRSGVRSAEFAFAPVSATTSAIEGNERIPA